MKMADKKDTEVEPKADDKKDEDKPEELVAPDEGKDLKMSRGPRPEAEIDFDKLNDLFVFDGFGNKIRFVDIFKKQKTIIIFTRVSLSLSLSCSLSVFVSFSLSLSLSLSLSVVCMNVYVLNIL